MPRAYRLADADFARPLRDAHQHDVHDHDAAHHQRNARDRHYDGRNHPQHLIDEAADCIRRQHVEIVRLAGTRVKARAQQHARLVQCAIHIQAAVQPGPPKQREAIARTVHAIECGDRNVHRVVQVAAEGRAQALLYADHREFDAFDVHRLIQRRRIAREQGGPHRIADHRHEGARTVFLLGEEAAIHHADVAYARHSRGSAQHRTVLADQVLALHVGDVLAVRTVEHAIAGEGFQEARVVRANRLVALQLVKQFAPAQAARGRNLRHQERLRPECLGGTLLGVHAEAFDRGAHHDHAGHADNHSQQGQEAAQLLRADGIHREPKCVEEVIPGADEPRVAVRHECSYLPG